MVWTSKAIAREMHINREAVYLHLARIRKKFGVHSTIEICSLIGNNQQEKSSMLTFTSRGREIFLLITDGLTDKKIADQLGVCYNTVRRYRELMLSENNCDNMIELIAKYNKRK